MYKYILITFTLLVAGCRQSPEERFTAQTTAPMRIKLTDSYVHTEQNHDFGKTELMEVAEDVLSEMYFTIEKADINNGLIRTRPLPGAQFFEFWRSDNIGAKNTIEANLHTIRRTVTLNITQQNNELSIGCEAHAQRLSLPGKNLRSDSQVYKMFSQSSQSLQTMKLNPEQAKQMAWIDLGRDSKLEAEILKRIQTQILRQITPLLRTMESKT